MATLEESINLKHEIYLIAAKAVKKSLRDTKRKPKFEEIFTLAVWMLQDDLLDSPKKEPFGFHGGFDAEMDFPEEPVDPLGLGIGEDDDDEYDE